MFVEQKISVARLTGVESSFSGAANLRAQLPASELLLELALRLRRP
jgi:hypothetical protein